ncbi:hypothetical protein LSM04_001140 [Trypanosoma melophagium]|uniref:uncharacterized protein n=1 Tax=Trypanosoma melophagium TaxID=715481 RepID=UPI00351AA4CE|nr:hypothetical protein LSM04_001140 [Trypanosoma melophagium]
MSEKWKKNPLFRLLAFLDIVGLQTFSVKNDITDDGTFIETKRTFGPDSVIHNILTRGLHTLHANITRLFLAEEERHILLRFIGDPHEATTPFCQGILEPSSLTSFLTVLENELPVWAFIRIKEVFGLMNSTTTTTITITEQFLIDALDDWMSHRSSSENDAMVLACGVQPAVLDSARARAEELPNAVEDFIIDVVFPPAYPSFSSSEVKDEENTRVKNGNNNKKNKNNSTTRKNNGLLDWLIAAYEKCHEIIDVEEEIKEEDENEDGRESSIESIMKKRRKEGEEESEEEFLTAENIDRFMRERPSVIPKEILREKRRPLQDSGITEFELKNHYTVNELSVFIKENSGEMRRLKKAECVRAILNYHRIEMKQEETSALLDKEKGTSKVP